MREIPGRIRPPRASIRVGRSRVASPPRVPRPRPPLATSLGRPRAAGTGSDPRRSSFLSSTHCSDRADAAHELAKGEAATNTANGASAARTSSEAKTASQPSGGCQGFASSTVRPSASTNAAGPTPGRGAAAIAVGHLRGGHGATHLALGLEPSATPHAQRGRPVPRCRASGTHACRPSTTYPGERHSPPAS